jgi:hypothetical protein
MGYKIKIQGGTMKVKIIITETDRSDPLYDPGVSWNYHIGMKWYPKEREPQGYAIGISDEVLTREVVTAYVMEIKEHYKLDVSEPYLHSLIKEELDKLQPKEEIK